MLFCFGLFALLLYYTVVANAECSYTFRSDSSQRHIEARSRDLELKGFQRCEFLIQPPGVGQQLELNFTDLEGFGLQAHALPEVEVEEESEGEKDSGGWGSVFANGSRNGTAHRGGEGRRGEDGREALSSGKGRNVLSTENADVGPGDEKHLAFTPNSFDVRSSLSVKVASVVRPPKLATPSQSSTSSSSLSSLSSSSSPLTPKVTSSTVPTNVNSTASAGSHDMSNKTVARPFSRSSQSSTQPSWVVGSTAATNGGGGAGAAWGTDDGPATVGCLPVVEIREVVGEGKEEIRHRICQQHHNTQTPMVFQYSSSVRIVFQWQPQRSSGFLLYFNSGPNDGCVHVCDGGRCLRDRHVLCDGRPDCRDQSDETAPVCPDLNASSFSSSSSSSPQQPLDAGWLVTAVAVPSCLLVLLVCFLLTVCTLGSRRCRCRLRRFSAAGLGRPDGHGGHLSSCPQSHSTEGLTPSGYSSQDGSEQAVALLSSARPTPTSAPDTASRTPWSQSQHCPQPQHQPKAQGQGQGGAARGPGLGLPVSVPVSRDGEEGYACSQQGLLHSRLLSDALDFCVPPPNKTVFDRESPPPYTLVAAPGCGGWGPREGGEAAGAAGLHSSSSAPAACLELDSDCLGQGPGWVPAGGRDWRSRCYTVVVSPAASSSPASFSPIRHHHHHRQHRHHHHRPNSHSHHQSPVVRPAPRLGSLLPSSLPQDRSDYLSTSYSSGCVGSCNQRLPLDVHGAFCTACPATPPLPYLARSLANGSPIGGPDLPSPTVSRKAPSSASSDSDRGGNGSRSSNAIADGRSVSDVFVLVLDAGPEVEEAAAPPGYISTLTHGRGSEVTVEGVTAPSDPATTAVSATPHTTYSPAR